MLTTLKNAFKIKDIRNRLLFTLVMLVVIRFGSQLPVPGVNRTYFADWFAAQSNGAFNFFDAFTGGSFMNMSVFALNITPYITSSIIMQLLTIAIPKLEEMQKDGEDGRKKITAITRFMTVGLAILESAGLAVSFGQKGYLNNYSFITVIEMIVILTAGSAFVMWLGERITERGVGNGISIILLINIVSTMPNDFKNVFTTYTKKYLGEGDYIRMTVSVVTVVVIVALVVALVCALQGAEREIPVQYAKTELGCF